MSGDTLPQYNAHEGSAERSAQEKGPGKKLTKEQKQQVARLKEDFAAADEKLKRLENELDALLRASRSLREERTDLMQNPVMCLNATQTKSDSDSLAGLRLAETDCDRVSKYLNLLEKSKRLDEAIEKVKADCTLARSECNWHFAQGRTFGSMKDASAVLWASLMIKDLYGAMEYDTDSKHLDDQSTLVRNIGFVVGTFGAAVTYTTLFSAARGRLDLISWSFACFVVLIINSSMLTCRPRPVPCSARGFFQSIRHRYTLGILLSLLLLIAAIVLLALSISMSDMSVTMVPGSNLAILLAGCLTLGWIAIRVVRSFWDYFPGWWHQLFWAQPINCKRYPTHAIEGEKRWASLPGGDDYARYRDMRKESHCNPMPDGY